MLRKVCEIAKCTTLFAALLHLHYTLIASHWYPARSEINIQTQTLSCSVQNSFILRQKNKTRQDTRIFLVLCSRIDDLAPTHLK